QVRLGRRQRQPEEQWLRVAGAGEPIVSASTFKKAQARLVRRRRLTDQQMIDDLRNLWRERGRLSHKIIASDKASACPAAYRNRFGSLPAAYERAGYS